MNFPQLHKGYQQLTVVLFLVVKSENFIEIDIGENAERSEMKDSSSLSFPAKKRMSSCFFPALLLSLSAQLKAEVSLPHV